MILSRNIWSVQDVRDLASRTKSIIKEELLTMEYTTAGNSYRKQFAVPDLTVLLNACDDYMKLYDPQAVDQTPDGSQTRTYLIS